ncbi:hypothetical protein ABGN05_14630 [Aquibium sp. LZ166]|uniref:Uncharacterized protein n=1 Tax=Aquibium pacificus TaxID=3153579 RepID=A0ABV3SJE9_9HYPH
MKAAAGEAFLKGGLPMHTVEADLSANDIPSALAAAIQAPDYVEAAIPFVPLGSLVRVTLTGTVEARDEINGNVVVAFETEEGVRRDWIDAAVVAVIE